LLCSGDKAKFNVAIYNYQSSEGNPAVLAIVATAQGTSAQIVENSGGGGQKLYYNKQGQRASFIGKRLSDDRQERGVQTVGEMTHQEKQQNMIMVIQVPLKCKPTFLKYDLMSTACFSSPPGAMEEECNDSRSADVEDAIISVGEAEGEFNEAGGLAIERDPAFPVRVTLQFYKSTANGVVDEDAIKKISEQIESSRKNADFIGSLVVGGDTGRPTEHVPKQTLPLWWNTFWLTYGSSLSDHTEDSAIAALIEQYPLFATTTMDKAKDRVLQILRSPSAWTPIQKEEPIYLD